jgi:hypothetical protein
MANYIEQTEINPLKFITASSRYLNSEVIYYTENKLLTFNTYRKHNVEKSPQDKTFLVKSEFEYRPDLVSYKAYGTVDFWWKIMEVNGIKDIFDFKSGLNIIIPHNIY